MRLLQETQNKNTSLELWLGNKREAPHKTSSEGFFKSLNLSKEEIKIEEANLREGDGKGSDPDYKSSFLSPKKQN